MDLIIVQLFLMIQLYEGVKRQRQSIFLKLAVCFIISLQMKAKVIRQQQQPQENNLFFLITQQVAFPEDLIQTNITSHHCIS